MLLSEAKRILRKNGFSLLEAAPERWGSGDSVESRRSASLDASSSKLTKKEFAKVYWQGLLAKDEEWGGYFKDMIFDDEMKLMEMLDHFTKTEEQFDESWKKINDTESLDEKIEILHETFLNAPDKQFRLFNKMISKAEMYRGIAIAADETVDEEYLGTSWTTSLKTAKQWAKNMREKTKQKMVILRAKLDPSNIDMKKSAFLFAMWNNIDGQGESEIRVLDEKKIELLEVL